MIETDHKITCVCVTKDRFNSLKDSIRSYINQTYTNKELLIVSQSLPDVNKIIKNYIGSLNRSDIFLMDARRNISLGELRKFGAYEASGDIICQWDDDDFYHPKRISTQYSSLINANAILSVYGSHLHFYKNSRELYYIDWANEPGEDWRRCLSGSVMYFKRIGNQYLNIVDNYPALRTEEDLNFIKSSFIEYPYVIIPQGYQYVYVYHGDNTTTESHHRKLEEKFVYTKEEMYSIKTYISQSCENISKMPIHVMGSNGLAFII